MARARFACYARSVTLDSQGRSTLADALRDRAGELLATWIARYERSAVRFRRATKAATYTAQVGSLLEALGGAASSELRPGSAATRELERTAAFLGAGFASEGATGFDIAALLLELREVVVAIASPAEVPALNRIFEWLTVVALDAFAASGLQSLRERVAEQLEVGTPVVEVLPKVPACLLVGAPPTTVLGGLLARLWMLAVGTGAPCLIVDCAGLAEGAEAAFDAAYLELVGQIEGTSIQILLASARRPVRERAAGLASERGLAFQHFDRFDSAVAHAAERAGYLLTRRS